MRILIALLIGLVAGAACFHVYYLGLDPAPRCGWDHPIDHDAREACEARATFKGYAGGARKKLDDLVGQISN